MEYKNAVKIEKVSKKYNLYTRPQDRFKEAIGFGKKNSLHTEFYALNNISFEVKKGETVGIIGTNGSGKSTLLKIITGVLKQTEGSVEVNGRISALLELGAGFNQEYTGLENIYLNGRMMGISKKEMESRVQSIIDFAEIGEFINQPVKTYSSGMFARLAFAVAINVEPDILIVDEALSVGDLFFQNKCFRKFEELKEKNITILFVSHDISSVRQMCSRVLWIEKGKQIIFDQSDKVCDMYMDMKRKGMNKQVDEIDEVEDIPVKISNEKKVYPVLIKKNNEGDLKSEKFDIVSCFFTNDRGKIVKHLRVDEKYKFHCAISFKEDMHSLIVGFVLENNKGLPLFDINNYINQQQGISGKKGYVTEAIYEFTLPRLMKGTYILEAAIAQGTQEQHEMLTWLHGIGNVEIINPGYNSSYIEIPAKIVLGQIEYKKVEFVETEN